MTKPRCSQHDCPNIAQVGGMCNRHIQQHRLRRRERGEWRGGNTVDSTPVIAHLDKLRAAGLGMRRIAELTGITTQTIRVLRRQKTVFAHTAYKILSLPVPDIPHHVAADSALVDATGTLRRLQALIAVGYSQEGLSLRMGMAPNVVNRILRETRVMAATARLVEATFNELCMIPGTGEKARRHAQRRNWVPPLAWDDDAIDNPAAQPPLASANTSRRLTAEEFADIVADHRELGRDDTDIATRLGYDEVKTFQRRLYRNGIPIRTAVA